MASASFHLLLALVFAIVANYFPAQCFLIVPKNSSVAIDESTTTVAPPQQQHPPPHQNVTCNITAMLMEMTNPATTPINLPSSKTIGKRSCCCCCCKPCCCCCCPCKCCSCCNPCCCNCCGECTCIKWAPCCCCPCCCGCTGYGRRRMMKFRRNAEISRYSEKRKSRSTNDGGEIV